MDKLNNTWIGFQIVCSKETKKFPKDFNKGK